MSSLKEKIDTLNSMIQQGAVLDAFEKFYAENVTMQENEDAPTVGKANNRVNEEAFVGGIVEFRKADIKNVIVSDNLTVVEWDFDFTHKDWGVRNYTQIAIQRWNDEGLIINEKFYYNH
ncbi:MAG: polyketide cyclase [Rickettsiales bacterium]|nr:polyketide cyclase [Rickettsiales bacterium]